MNEKEQITAKYYEENQGYDLSTSELDRQRGKIRQKNTPCDEARDKFVKQKLNFK